MFKELAAAGVLLMVSSMEAEAQALGVPAALDVRVDAAFPLGEFGDIASTGVGLGAGFIVTAVPGFGVYAGFSHTRFGGTADARDTGLAAGLSATLPGTFQLTPWVGGGLLFHRLEVDGMRAGDGFDVGFELGGGVGVPLAGQFRLTPAVNYRRYDTTIPALAGLAERSMTVQYFSLGVGLHISF